MVFLIVLPTDSTDVDSDQYFEEKEEDVQKVSAKSTQNAEIFFNEVTKMTQEEMQHLIQNLGMRDSEEEEERNVKPQQKDKSNKAQPTNKMEDEPLTIKKKKDIENISDNKKTKQKKIPKGKKKNTVSSNDEAQSDDNVGKVENTKVKKGKQIEDEDINKKLNKDDNVSTKSKLKQTTDIHEKKATKNRKLNNESNEGGNMKSSTNAASDNVQKSEPEGRVMRSTRARNLMKDNEPSKNPTAEVAPGRNKLDGRKAEQERNKTKENPEADLIKEPADQKKKVGKKINPKIVKKVLGASKESQPIAPEMTKNNSRKNVKKDAPENNENVPLTEITTELTKKNIKEKNKTAITETVEPQTDAINVENSKIKSKSVLAKNKKVLQSDENKINEDSIVKKRATRKK